jgi:hypothetical protein
MWRKTRSKVSGSLCVGVDPNRNWDAGFGGERGDLPPPPTIRDGQAVVWSTRWLSGLCSASVLCSFKIQAI